MTRPWRACTREEEVLSTFISTHLMFTSMSRSFSCQQVLEWSGAEVGGDEGDRGGGGDHRDCSWL